MVKPPPALKPGDTIGVFAPSSWVDREDIEKSTRIMEERGFKIFVHPQTYERHNQSAGTTLQKALALQGLWQRKDINAIWAAGGGNRCLHLTDSINFKRLSDTPKILIGFSDVTALLNRLSAHCEIATFHGPVFKNLHKYNQTDHLFDLLSGKEGIRYPVTQDNIMMEGKAEGPLFGGNLSVFQYLPQLLDENALDNAILFLEDCNEELSRLDRMLLHLKHHGVFNKISGLVLGQFTNIPESGKPFGFKLHDLIAEHLEGVNIPVLHNMPFGHGKDLYTFPIGVRAQINTSEKRFMISGAATAAS